MSRISERGAVAVEFAIVLPILLFLLIGLVEFGRVFNAQIILTNAAREGARTMAITGEVGRAESAVLNAATGLTPQLLSADFTIAAECTAINPAFPADKYSMVTITYKVMPMTRIIGPIKLDARAVSRCDA